MIAFVDQYRDQYGVEPICRILKIAPSGYYKQVARARDPELRPDCSKRADQLCIEIQRVWDDNMQCYSVVKVWKQLQREQFEVARCTVRRLMQRLIVGYGFKQPYAD